VFPKVIKIQRWDWPFNQTLDVEQKNSAKKSNPVRKLYFIFNNANGKAWIVIRMESLVKNCVGS
tara:strand:- start:763 stop:954 length:192 start_codon:yes stop_codon:yes gene_type:complete